MDKTGLIALINDSINTPRMLTCVSRPRRFGKSFAVKMLCAYYDFSCNSGNLFDGLDISKKDSYLLHLNKYHVINLDITSFISAMRRQKKPVSDVPNEIVKAVHDELLSIYPDILSDGKEKSLTDCLIQCVEKTGRKFIFLIDE